LACCGERPKLNHTQAAEQRWLLRAPRGSCACLLSVGALWKTGCGWLSAATCACNDAAACLAACYCCCALKNTRRAHGALLSGQWPGRASLVTQPLLLQPVLPS
jgi:hypothetical protein